ncbi:TonB-dependent receptor domain-containing protein [Telmatobacter bradus]|uniref:TonB-dependent receptor domain-containing protein n=1 Tax=Telmatobacter bradus TaxID=474953 RepID=UPI003B43BF03
MVTNLQHLPARRAWIPGVLSAVVLCLFSLGLHAQQYLAGVSGTITDGTGAVVVGATVTAENVDTHFKTLDTTNQVGAYVIPFLTPGTYSVTVAANGFRSAEKTGVVLHASDKGIVDLRLSVGTQSESIQVTVDLQTLDTGSASLGQVLDKQEVVELPNIGRNPFVEATLAAGTYSGNFITGSASQYNQPYSGTASQMQIGGLGNEHRLELNGMPDDAPERLSAVTYTDFVPSPEAVQEVNTQTLLVDAQYGHSDGAVINTIVKTGQNELHGSAYYILQNTDLNANTTQRKQSTTQSTKGQPSVNRWQQPGFVVDGPIRLPKLYNGHDKSFFMVAYEHIQTNTPNPYTGFMPTDAMRKGDFSSLCSTFNSNGFCTSGIQLYNPNSPIDSSGNRTSYFANNNVASAIDPVAAAIIKYFPEPNSANPTSSVNYISGDDTIKDHYWSFITRIDHKLTEQQTLTGLFFRSIRNQLYPVQGFGINGNGVGGPGYSHFRKDTGASVDWTYQLSPSLVLDSRLGFVYHPFSLTYYGDNFNLTSLGFSSTFASAVPRETFPGISFTNGVNGYSSITGGGGQYSEATASSWNEVLTKVIRNHSVKVGFEGEDLRYDLISTSAAASNIGTFNFTRGFTQKNYTTSDSTSGDPMASFLTGAINSDTVNWYGPMAYDQKYVGFFLHDDWRLKNKLTLNMGIRWDYEAPMTERHNQMNAGFCAICTNPLQSSVSGLTLNGGLQFASSSHRMGYNKELNNWQPRFGLAYQLTNKSVLRGGFGMIYMPTFDQPGATGFSQSTSYTSTTSSSPSTPAHSFANPYPSGLVSPTGSSLGLETALGQALSPEDTNHLQPRLFFGSLGVEYQLPRNAVIEVDYVANASRHMQVSKAINALPSSDFALGATELNTLVSNPMSGLISSNSTLNASTIVKSALLAPYPEFGGITMYNRPLGYTSYNAMQVSVHKRFNDGFSFQFHYTWSKQMNATGYLNSTDNWDQLFRRESSSPNRLWNVLGSYEFPTLFRNNYYSRMVLGGWSFHAVVRSHNGLLISYPGASGSQVDRVAGANLHGGGNNRSMLHQFNTCYLDASGVIHPGGWNSNLSTGACSYGDGSPAWKLRTATTTATTGYALTTATYNTILPGIRQMVLPIADASLFKKFVIHNKVNFELRGEFFNIANTPNYGTPNSTLTTTGSSGAGTLTWSQGNDPRLGQVTARINF